MTPLNPATLAFPFGSVDQGKGERHLLAGELTEARNVRMLKEDEWRKRPGFDRLVCSTFGPVGVVAGHSGTPKEYEIVAGADMWRDGAEQVWSRDADSNIAYYRGKQVRAFPTQFPLKKAATNNGETSTRKPVAALAGQDLWIFSMHTSPTGPYDDYSSYTLTVLDATTRVVKHLGAASVSGITNISNWSVAYDSVNGKVWLMVVGMDDVIQARSHTASSPQTSPTVTTYRSVSGKAFNTVDIHKLANGEFLVAASSFVPGTPHTMYFEHSYLNTATGLAKTSPAAVGTTTTAAVPAAQCCTGISILNYDGAIGTAYYALWRTKASPVTSIQLVIVDVNTTTLAISAGPSELFAVGPVQTASPIVGVCSGYRAANGNREVFSQFNVNGSVPIRSIDISRWTWNGSSSTETVVAYQDVLLSKPFLQGSDYYIVCGYDDGQTVKAQRTYFLRNQDGKIASVFLPGEGSAAWHQAAGRDSGGGLYLHNTGFVNTPVNTGSVWIAPVVGEDAANESAAVHVVELDFGETYAPPTVMGEAGVAVWNGPIPQVAGPRDDLHDLAPLLFPTAAPTFGLGTGAALGTFQVAYRYRFQDSSGRVYRSSPSATASAAFLASSGRTVAGQALSHIGQGEAYIEIYGSVAGGTDLYLQQVGYNNTNGSTISVQVFPERWTATGELLDTTGGALSQAPPPGCRCSALWRGRLHLSGCTEPAEIWSSKEIAPGRGPEFNEALVTEWLEGTGAPELMQPCDWNYLSVHKSDAVGLLSGPGPDGRGAGGYTVLTVSGKKAGRVGSAVTGPSGAYFQNVADGRICLLPPGAPVAVDIGRGVESHRTTTVVAALHVESEQAMWFLLSDGKVLVLHYAFATPTSPYGRWSVYSGPSLAAVGAAMSGTTPRFLESSTTVAFRSPGAVWVDANAAGNADVLMKIALSKLRPAGHQQEIMVDRCYFEGQHVGSSNLRITVTNDLGQTEPFTKTGTASPLDYMVTPGAQTLRTKEFGISIEETASTTEGFVFDTFAADIKTVAKIKVPNAGNWIAPG